MKKLKLKIQQLSNPSVLTRQQLKNVMGGTETVTTSPKIAACKGKKVGDDCSWYWDGYGTQYGTCQTFQGEALHCSDLN